MDRIAMLEAENLRLKDHIAFLEQALIGPSLVTPIEWRLTASERRVFGAIVSRPLATKDTILAALYRNDGRDEAAIKIVDVFVCKLRKKLKPFDIEILTIWGQGYSIDPSARESLRRQMLPTKEAA